MFQNKKRKLLLNPILLDTYTTKYMSNHIEKN